ncbi:uncharacterized protein LOC131674645 [Phymastichus coffea]|uniref:uncharacterized protein LOC131674645 n=1 Tax=Phymastichus coffea TaxID=108790 RepID=UPI00273CADD6|nr:uncharacterized protein LOC131674645 [Phymastichus coffea]
MYGPRASGERESEPEPAAAEPKPRREVASRSGADKPSRELAPRPTEFSPEMLRDQELLVSTLSQQGVSQALISRQFNRLLEEQAKQLTRSREPARALEELGCARERGEPPEAPSRPRPKPDQQAPRSRNNGLQDHVTAARIVDRARQRSESRPADAPRFRLNGAQERDAPDAEAFCRTHFLCQPSELPPAGCGARRNVSANGLENARRQTAAACLGSVEPPDEPVRQRSTEDADLTRCSADTNSPVPGNGDDNDKLGDCVASLHQLSDIQEPRMFGGFTYFVRKPQYLSHCNAHQHLQQPSSAKDRLQNSQLSATHPGKHQHKSVCASKC